MGGKGQQSSSTSVDIPPELRQALLPLLQNSTARMLNLQNQGYNVLQGQQPGAAPAGGAPAPYNGSAPRPGGVGGGGGGGGGGGRGTPTRQMKK